MTLEQQQAIALANARLRLQEPQPTESQVTESQFAETSGGAAVGRPVRGVRLNVQPEPRPLESFAAGVTKSAIDPLLGGAQMITGGGRGVSEAVKRLSQEADVYSEANPYSYGTGRVAGVALPAVGMSRAIGMIPSFAKNPYASGAVIGSGTGAVSGALQPVETGQTGMPMYEEMGRNARTGALIGAPVGAVAPVIGQLVDKGVRAGKALVEPFLESGQEKIMGRFLRQMSGGEEAKAMRNLRNPQQLVAGSQPTTAQVAGVPSLAALERTLMATDQTAGNLMAQRQAQNAQAQAAALRNIAPASRISKYANFREEVADDLYKDALKPLNLGKLDDATTKEIVNLTKRPAIQDAMQVAKETSANRGMDIADPAGSMLGLHRTKIALDKKIGEVKARYERDKIKSSTGDELDGLMNAKTSLLGFMEKISPTYKQARQSFERLSKPIDQLESIAKLADKSISPETEKIYISQFSKGLKDLKQSGVVSNRQIARLEAIEKDLARGKFAATEGKGVGSDTVQKLAYSNLMSEVGLPISASNRLGRFVYGDVNEQLRTKLAESMLDPKEALRLMRAGGQPKVSPDQKTRNDLARLLTIQGIQNTVQGASNE
tara:strand:+ start:180 stop:1997 length:1818 start_codon:yes stop_codon:yes gene_type:complete